MKAVRLGIMLFAIISLMGGYLLHQYFWFSGAEASSRWNELVLPLTMGLGWILMVAAIVLSFTEPESDSE